MSQTTLNEQNIFYRENNQHHRVPPLNQNADNADTWPDRIMETLLYVIETAYDAHDHISIIMPDENELTITEHEHLPNEDDTLNDQPIRFIISEQNITSKTRKEGVLLKCAEELSSAINDRIPKFEADTGQKWDDEIIYHHTDENRIPFIEFNITEPNVLLHAIALFASMKGIQNNLFPLEKQNASPKKLKEFQKTASPESLQLFQQHANYHVPHDLLKTRDDLTAYETGESTKNMINVIEAKGYLIHLIDNTIPIVHFANTALQEKFQIFIGIDQEQLEITLYDEVLETASPEEQVNFSDEFEYLYGELVSCFESLYPGLENTIFKLHEAEENENSIGLVIEVAELDKAIRCIAFYAQQNGISNDLYPPDIRHKISPELLKQKLPHICNDAGSNHHHIDSREWEIATTNVLPHSFVEILEQYDADPIETLKIEHATVDYEGQS